MSKRKNYSNADVGKKALSYGSTHGFGPFSNPRHPKRCPPITKKAAPSASNTESGKETPHSTN